LENVKWQVSIPDTSFTNSNHHYEREPNPKNNARDIKRKNGPATDRGIDLSEYCHQQKD
jgi:hypothetical protein